MLMKGFPPGSQNWVRPYYATMPEFDKALTAEAFCIPGEENQECVILMAWASIIRTSSLLSNGMFLLALMP